MLPMRASWVMTSVPASRTLIIYTALIASVVGRPMPWISTTCCSILTGCSMNSPRCARNMYASFATCWSMSIRIPIPCKRLLCGSLQRNGRRCAWWATMHRVFMPFVVPISVIYWALQSVTRMPKYSSSSRIIVPPR